MLGGRVRNGIKPPSGRLFKLITTVPKKKKKELTFWYITTVLKKTKNRGSQKDKINPITLNERAMFCRFSHENCQVFGGFELVFFGGPELVVLSLIFFFPFKNNQTQQFFYINLFWKTRIDSRGGIGLISIRPSSQWFIWRIRGLTIACTFLHDCCVFLLEAIMVRSSNPLPF